LQNCPRAPLPPCLQPKLSGAHAYAQCHGSPRPMPPTCCHVLAMMGVMVQRYGASSCQLLQACARLRGAHAHCGLLGSPADRLPPRRVDVGHATMITTRQGARPPWTLAWKGRGPYRPPSLPCGLGPASKPPASQQCVGHHRTLITTRIPAHAIGLCRQGCDWRLARGLCLDLSQGCLGLPGLEHSIGMVVHCGDVGGIHPETLRQDLLPLLGLGAVGKG
jgi:hypothetical protein